MRKKILLSVTMLALMANQSVAADYSNIKGISILKADCTNGPAGFEVIVKYIDSEDSILFNSCEDTDEIVSDDSFTADANIQNVVLTSPTRTTQSVTRNYTLPNGYTEPSIEADNSCSGGYQDIFAWGRTSCNFSEGSSDLDSNGGLNEGWLNLVTSSDYHTLSGLGLRNINNLKNFHIINNGNLSITGTRIENVNGLINLSGHSNQTSSTFTGSTWGSDRITTTGSHRGLDLKNNKMLENINGLINYRGSDWVDLTGNEKLTNISGLANLKLRSSYAIYVDDKEYNTKLPADSWLCQNPSKIKIKTPSASPTSSSNGAIIADYSKVCD